jgi:hypothetical protein
MNDSAPHFGGSYIRGQVHQNACTSGFTVKNAASTRFMVTAGHCWPQGEVVFGGTNLNWGKVVNKAAFPNRDMELIGGGNYGLDIYTGLAAGNATLVKAAADPAVGPTNYCHSGAFSFEGCGHHVVSMQASICNDDGSDCTNGVIAFRDGLPPEDGDSGGPFYNYTTGGVTIRGLFLGGARGTFYAERWEQVKAQFAVNIVHG